jgi:hypothetical protein
VRGQRFRLVGATRSLAPWLPHQEGVNNSLCRGQSFSDGIFGELGNGPDLQFDHEVLTMGFHGFDADVQTIADLGRGLTFSDELQHFPLSGRKQIKS